MEKKIWYAVQHGDNFDLDFGSESHEKAVKIAESLASDSDYDGQEIRIAVIDDGDVDKLCIDEEIIRDGWRVRPNPIKELRERTGLTQTEFGAFLGIPMRTIQNWEGFVSTCPSYVVDLIRSKIDCDGRF